MYVIEGELLFGAVLDILIVINSGKTRPRVMFMTIPTMNFRRRLSASRRDATK